MDDIGNAPSNGAESTAAPETQAPEATTERASPNARAAIEKAFATVTGETQEPEAKATADRARDEAGRFAKAAEDAVKAATEAAKTEPAKPIVAPQRFAKVAQEAWAQTPEPVRAEVERAMSEMQAGIDKYKSSAEAFEPIREFDAMARQGGTTLKDALSAYVNMENMLRNDPAQGLVALAQNLGMTPQGMAEMLMGMGQGQAQQPAGDSRKVQALEAELRALKEQVGGVTQTFEQQRKAEVERTIAAFAQEHPYLDQVAEPIEKLLRSGMAPDLPTAYEMAVRLTPEVFDKVQAEKQAATKRAQTPQKAALTVTGSPNTGSNPTKAPPGSPRQAIADAFERTGIRF